MAVTVENMWTRVCAPSALKLHIDAGQRPNGHLELTSATGSQVRIHIDFAELVALADALFSDPRLKIDNKKWTASDRARYDEQLAELLKGI